MSGLGFTELDGLSTENFESKIKNIFFNFFFTYLIYLWGRLSLFFSFYLVSCT